MIISVNLRFLTLFLSCCLTYIPLKAQWLYTSAFEIHENQGVAHSNYPLAIDIDTKALIEAGLMNANGSDLRFSAGCENMTFIPHWIESGINTQHTIVWIKLTALQANEKLPVFMHYGNPAAASASAKSGMFTDSIIITSNTSLSPIDTLFEADYIEVRSGTITLASGHPGIVKFKGEFIFINTSATLNADGAGYLGGLQQQNGSGPGGGGKVNTAFGGGGGGAGYGGAGGKGSAGSAAGQGMAGAIAGTNNGLDIDKGSGGGGGDQNQGANGGGAFIFRAQQVTNKGTVSVKGIQGNDLYGSGGCGGGGSGGGILMVASHIINKGKLDLEGGDGSPAASNWPGGAGGGGRLKFACQSYLDNNTGTVKLDGGAAFGGFDPTDPPAEAGGNGRLSIIPLNNVFNSLHPSQLLTLSPSADTIITGDTLILTASGPYPVYEFLHNGVAVQNGSDPVFTTVNVQKGDRFIVKNYEQGGTCILVSNPFIPVVEALNIPPDAQDDAVAVPKNFVEFPIKILDNDYDSNSNIDTLAGIAIFTNPAHGMLSSNAPGELVYTPDLDFIGDDQFLYSLCDKPGLCDTAVVYITVYDEFAGNAMPSANPDHSTTWVNTSDTIAVLSNDIDPDGWLDLASLQIVSAPSNGTAQLETGSTGRIIYTPNSNFKGTDEFIYQICDSGGPALCDTATVTIAIKEDPNSIPANIRIQLNIYPNPANRFIHISMEKDLTVEQVFFYSSLGIKIPAFLGRADPEGLLLNTESLVPGIYFVQMITSKGIYTGQFIKE